MEEIYIDYATLEDAESLARIYAYYVEHTAITFEYNVPTVEEFIVRMKKILKKYPYLVAKKDDRIVGFAYADSFKSRAAYDYSVETSIYVDYSCKRMGIGSKLYNALESKLKQQGILNMYACIAYPEIEDAYLSKNSVQYHERLGYRLVGEFYQCGYKFNTWYNMVWMEKILGEHVKNPAPIRFFEEIRDKE